MSPEEIRGIATARLAGWTERLVAEHATPIALVGVGHDHASGRVIVVALEDLTDAEIAAFIWAAAGELAQRAATGGG